MLYSEKQKEHRNCLPDDVKKVTWSVADFNMEMGYGEKGQKQF